MRRRQVTAGSRPDIPLSCPRPIEDLIKACWDQDPAKRPAADRLLDLLKDVAAKVA